MSYVRKEAKCIHDFRITPKVAEHHWENFKLTIDPFDSKRSEDDPGKKWNLKQLKITRSVSQTNIKIKILLFSFTFEALITSFQSGDWYEMWCHIGGGGGHQIFIDNFKFQLCF